ncbi:hypothetical protein O1M54_09605 [Streptomyces diastatochromogenes]|nr:hypothetical protein [Streptomyces diastatochromogenes]
MSTTVPSTAVPRIADASTVPRPDAAVAAWSPAEFTDRLRAVTAARYHDRHPFNLRMHRGELTPPSCAAGSPHASTTSGTSPSRTP